MNRQLNRLFLWLLSVIVLSTSSFISNVVVSAASCPPGDNCGPYGVCITDTDQCANGICQRRCSCYPGYYGDDCSFVVDICPDQVASDGEQTCFNGGKCYAVQESSGSSFVTAYQCDCRTASGEAAVYAGTRCEFPGEISCESGKRMSTYAFCVNGGRCRHTVNSGQSFAGCDCTGLFEGRHCQYAMGTAPQDELIYMPAQKKGGLGAFSIFIIIVLALGFAVGMFVFVWRRATPDQREWFTTTSNAHTNGDGIGGENKEFEVPPVRSSNGEAAGHGENDLALEEVPIDGSDDKRIV